MLGQESKILPLLQLAQFKAAAGQIFTGYEAQAKDLELTAEAYAFFEYLKTLKVTKTSSFLDSVWDWNGDNPNVAKTMRGSMLVLDFRRFSSIPAAVILEVKVVAQCYAIAPGVLTPIHDKTKSKKPSKSATIARVFAAGLLFIDALYSVLSRELGDEFVNAEMNALAKVPGRYYEAAAKEFKHCYSSKIRQFFAILWSPFFRDTVFDGALAEVNPNNLKWHKIGKEFNPDAAPVKAKQKVMANESFKKASMVGSLVIVDFLDAMNEHVIDVASLDRRNDRGYFASIQHGLTPESFAVYTYKRLHGGGHPIEDIRAAIGSDESYVDEILSCCTVTALKRHEEKHGFTPDGPFWRYLNLVGYACMYIIGQYTGMRTSELADLVGKTCLQPDGDNWVIKSNVHKHQDESALLFDDYWVAIPIVRDAVRASVILSRYKNNPYVYCSSFTVPYGEVGEALSPTAYNSTLQIFMKEVLSSDQYAELNFYPYMLRHTLAYQLYRADVGLPFISHQLKHFSGIVGNFGLHKGFSKTTLAYGEIGDMLAGAAHHDSSSVLRHAAELELVTNVYDPDKGFAGSNAKDHVASLRRTFEGYMAAGYSKEEIFEAITRQKIAVISVGQAFCYGNRAEDFDASIPCIGGLRCNPNRCSNAVITEGNAPAWRSVYDQNKLILHKPDLEHLHEAAKAAMDEARSVLLTLGHEVDDE
ncbi:tyrosine-type recombinase/integrase [Pseudomonas sp. P1.8]|uniref:tyrosine-type recombinase/integrase n=1 Tax=Pseudomonas sp. P1.8 TaxID=1699310 RepID=UPI00069DE05B|nr:tyrosine-type recombinase/integrase [Pseudomonas sp. P1.8]